MTLPSLRKHIQREARRSTMRHRLGAIIVKNGKVISSAHNSRRHVSDLPIEWTRRKGTICAERMVLIKRMGPQKDIDKLRGSVVYVGRIGANGCFLYAKPCEACLSMMRDLGVKRIYYTDNGGKFLEV